MRSAVLVGAAGVGALALARRGLRNLGATCAERRATLPGDELMPDAKSRSTMAITIDAPPSAVWPWLMQMGCDRAGFYSWDRLDNGGRPSATEIRPEWQDLDVGDRMLCTPNGRYWFQVKRLESERLLVLRSSIDVRTHRPFDPAGPRPRYFVDGVWSFVLKEVPDGKTRLVVRSFGAARPQLLLGAANLLFMDPAHVVMQVRQLQNLKRRAESPLREPVLVAAA
jgi:proline iminopeptidase